MKYLAAFFAFTFSASLSAKVVTFECVPNQPKEEFIERHKFVVDMDNKTWEWGESVFTDVVVSGGAVSVKGSREGVLGVYLETFSVSRTDLTYTRRRQTNFGDDSFKGQCEIVEDKVERAF